MDNQAKLPREGSVMYKMMYGDEGTRKKTVRQFTFWNKWFVKPLYRANILPLFGAGRIFLLLYHIGRKSGKQYITPLEHKIYKGDIYIFSSRGKNADWFRNVSANPDKVKVKKGFRTFVPEVSIVESVEDRYEVMKWYVTIFPQYAKPLFGWNKKTDVPDPETLRPICEFLQLVRLTPPPKK